MGASLQDLVERAEEKAMRRELAVGGASKFRKNSKEAGAVRNEDAQAAAARRVEERQRAEREKQAELDADNKSELLRKRQIKKEYSKSANQLRGSRTSTLPNTAADPEPAADAPAYEKFLYALRRRFGTLTRAWKVGLDPLNHGKLTFQQFCKAVRNLSLGEGMNFKQVWNDINVHSTHELTMREFCREEHALLEEFKQYLRYEHDGSLVQAWKVSIDWDKTGWVKKPSLVKTMKEMGWRGNAGRVFDLLDHDCTGMVTLRAFDDTAHDAHVGEYSDAREMKYGGVASVGARGSTAAGVIEDLPGPPRSPR